MRVRQIWSPPLIGLVVALSLTACSKPAPQDPRTEVPLVAIATVAAAADMQRSFTGVVAARFESDIGFRVGGKVILRLVDTGQHVVRGQVLMRLDPADLALESTAQENEVEAARAKSVQANADLKRLAGLVEQGAVSAQQYDQAVAAQKSASAQLSAASAQEGVARNANRYTVLVSDVDGIVTNTFADPGRVVTAGQTVVAIARDGQREAAVDLPENVRPVLGTAAVASVYGVDQKPITARLRELSSSANLQTRTYAARFVLEGPDNNAPLGATVTVRLRDDSTAGQLTLPVSALYDSGTGPGVWLLDTKSSTIGFRPVKVGAVGEEDAHIVSGLQPGDQVVALGAHLLHNREKVRVAPVDQQRMFASSDGDAK
jgi:RND family efflux transporter MFP subunit